MYQFKEKNQSAFPRGYFGIAILSPKCELNVGVLWRTASLFKASFIATVGERRYKTNNSDTMKSWKHMPLFHYESLEEFKNHIPKDCSLIGVELTQEARLLQTFIHPERAVYLLGSEDYGIPSEMHKEMDMMIQIETPINVSLNVGVAGSIIIYDRNLKSNFKGI